MKGGSGRACGSRSVPASTHHYPSSLSLSLSLRLRDETPTAALRISSCQVRGRSLERLGWNAQDQESTMQPFSIEFGFINKSRAASSSLLPRARCVLQPPGRFVIVDLHAAGAGRGGVPARSTYSTRSAAAGAAGPASSARRTCSGVFRCTPPHCIDAARR